jgi:GNAT superfamily N-acetyltransferase
MRFIPTFLPGRFEIGRGEIADYASLERFHYRAGRPATWARICSIHYHPPASRGAEKPNPWSGVSTDCNRPRPAAPDVNARGHFAGAALAAVGVLSYPVPSCLARRRYFRLNCTRSDELKLANLQIRTISRVIVHPRFRALGLSKSLIEWMCDHCDTRYVEAMAVMGRAHPLFERAGMTRIDPPDPSMPIYYILDRRNRPARLRCIA